MPRATHTDMQISMDFAQKKMVRTKSLCLVNKNIPMSIFCSFDILPQLHKMSVTFGKRWVKGTQNSFMASVNPYEFIIISK